MRPAWESVLFESLLVVIIVLLVLCTARALS
jgi:hypothetical protein